MISSVSKPLPRRGFAGRVFSFWGMVVITGTLVVLLMGAVTVGQAASDYVMSRIRELPLSFRTEQQNAEAQKAYSVDPLQGSRVAPIDQQKLPPKG